MCKWIYEICGLYWLVLRGIYVENGDEFLMDGWNDTE